MADIRAELARLSDDLRFVKRRLSAYLGDGVALTYLADETRMFVNTRGRVVPINLIDGGQYEDDNLEVLFSYLTPETLFLDIGANLGFFSLQIALRLRGKGKVMAFEPHPLLCDLLRHSAFLNGVSGRIEVCNHGLSDRAGPQDFHYPLDDLGGGHVAGDSPVQTMIIPSRIIPLDQVLAPGTAVDLVKMDVEGHELQVMRGMRRVITESPGIVILFEKLGVQAGYESEIEDFFSGLGFELFAVLPTALSKFVRGGMNEFSGYVVAARPTVVGSLGRAFFSIYPMQLWVHRPEAVLAQTTDRLSVAGSPGEILFHGPYWFLRRGGWRLTFVGNIRGRVALSIAERFGRPVVEFTLDEHTKEQRFVADRDLIHFEVIARSLDGEAQTDVEQLIFTRLY
jgi:FkbM family methyltransferase